MADGNRINLGKGLVWIVAILGSLSIHALGLSVGLAFLSAEGPKPRRVVQVETISWNPGWPGGGRGGSPQKRATPPEAASVKPVPLQKSRPQKQTAVKKRRIKAKSSPQPLVHPPPSLALPRPANQTLSRVSFLPPDRAASGGASGQGATGRGSAGGTGLGSGTGTGTGTGSGRGVGSGSGKGSLLGVYLQKVRSLLEKQKNYPMMARRQNQEGVVVLQFTINSRGQIEGTRVRRSSGHDLLDQAARETLLRVGCFPPFPAELKRRQLTIEVPLAYRLEED
jgi:protein TonB